MSKLNRLTIVAAATAIAAISSSCGTKRTVANDSPAAAVTADGKTAKTGSQKSDNIMKLDFLRKVTDNAVYANNIVSKIKFTMNNGRNDISVAGSLHMRKDEVIRIQLTPFGIMEAGRLEFTKDYVLLVDRINKEYVKASYESIDFLQRNGLDFYALQALFWNQLFVPGTQKTTDSSLKNFSVSLSGTAENGTTASDENGIGLCYGKMTYLWNADPKTARINSVSAKYQSGGDNASVTCKYSDFKALGTKMFPTDILLTMSTKAVKNADKMSLRLQLNSLGTDSNWETKTTVSSKYKQVTAEEILGKLGSL